MLLERITREGLSKAHHTKGFIHLLPFVFFWTRGAWYHYHVPFTEEGTEIVPWIALYRGAVHFNSSFIHFGLGGTKRHRNTFPTHRGLSLKVLFSPGSSVSSAAPQLGAACPSCGKVWMGVSNHWQSFMQGVCVHLLSVSVSAASYCRPTQDLMPGWPRKSKLSLFPRLLWPCSWG